MAALVLRLLLGGVFLYSAWEKLHRSSPMWEDQRTMYDVWVGVGTAKHYAFVAGEVALGVWLVSGLWAGASAAACIAVLLVYVAMLGYQVAQENPLPCGCFRVTPGGGTIEEIRRELWMAIARNVVLIGACAWCGFVGGLRGNRKVTNG